MEESIGWGAPSSSSIGFHIGTLAWRSGTISVPELSAVFLLYGPLAVFALFWGFGSLGGGISPSSNASLPFLSLFLFFFRGSAGEVWEGIGVRDWGWTTTLSVDPLACDSSSSSRLVFLRWSTIASGTTIISWMLLTRVEDKDLGVMLKDSARSCQLNTSKSSSKSTTSSTQIVSFSCSASEEITSFSTVRWSGSST